MYLLKLSWSLHLYIQTTARSFENRESNNFRIMELEPSDLLIPVNTHSLLGIERISPSSWDLSQQSEKERVMYERETERVREAEGG